MRCRYISRCCAALLRLAFSSLRPPPPSILLRKLSRFSRLHETNQAISSFPFSRSSRRSTHHQESDNEPKETPANMHQLSPLRLERKTHRIELKTSITRILTTAHPTH